MVRRADLELLQDHFFREILYHVRTDVSNNKQGVVRLPGKDIAETVSQKMLKTTLNQYKPACLSQNVFVFVYFCVL